MSNSIGVINFRWQQIKSLLNIIMARSFDRLTHENRSRDRYRRIAVTYLTSIISKGISILTAIISVPMTLNYLGKERYGLWMTASSIMIIVSFADLGMGNGLLNLIVEANGKNNLTLAKKAVSNAFFMLTLIAGSILIFFFAAYDYVPWARMFNVSSKLASNEVAPSLGVFILILSLNMPLAVVQRVQMGYQEGYVNDIYQIAGNLLGLLGVFFVVYLRLGLPWLIAFFAGPPLIVTFVNFAMQFLKHRPWLRPTLNMLDKTLIIDLLRTGSIFFILNILTIIGFQTDNIVISKIYGASAVAEYSIVQKISTIAYIYWFFIQALWPAYGEAIVRNDFEWVRKTLWRSFVLSSFGGLVIGFFLSIFGQYIVKIWIGGSAVPEESIFIGFSVFILINGFIGIVAVLLNSSFLFKKQLFPFLIATIFTLVLKIFFTKTLGVGYTVWATNLGYSLFYLIPMVYIIRIHFWIDNKTGDT